MAKRKSSTPPMLSRTEREAVAAGGLSPFFRRRPAPRVQAKLSVGAPSDRYEREADHVADHVMRMAVPDGEEEETASPGTASSSPPDIQEKCQDCEEEGEAQRQPEEDDELQLASETGNTSEVSSGVASQVRSLRGGGQPLSSSARSFMEPRFGRDFSQVRVHTGARASAAAEALQAKAFTTGNDIVFRSSQYALESKAGKRLLAHELTHVVQQRGAASHVQRKIEIGGKEWVPTKSVKYLVGNFSADFIGSMHKSTSTFSFASLDDLKRETRLRYHATKAIAKSNATGSNRCCSYPSSGNPFHLDSTFWDKRGDPLFTLKSGAKPSEAVEAIFKDKAGTVLECNSLMVAAQYHAMLKTIGAKAFDAKFAGGAGLIISPHHVVFGRVVSTSSGPVVVRERHPIWSLDLFERVTISGSADVLPGDWVYFKNLPDYSSKHPGGFWTGEHAVYLGKGKFSGFGVGSRSESKMEETLLARYNDSLSAADKVASVADAKAKATAAGAKFGLQNYARRPKEENIK